MAGNSSFDQDKHRLADYDTDSSGSSSSGTRCYNAKTGEFLGRSFVSWSKLVAFFCLFSAILAAFWGLFWVIFTQTLAPYRPKVMGGLSIINSSSPGLGYRPHGGLGYYDQNLNIVKGASMYSSLIWFQHGGNGNYKDLTKDLDTFLDQYESGAQPNQGSSITKCDFNSGRTRENQMCEFNREWLSDSDSDIKCITEEHYGYYFGKPCIMLKMNRVFGWVPVPYTIMEVRNHTTMPRRLKADIESVWENKCGGDPENYCPELNMVWLHCDGETDADKEIMGTVSYHPFHGFPGYFFPYSNQIGYLSPLVMLQLKNPTPAVLMMIQCTVWAKNIDHNSPGAGHVHFELLMD